MFLLLCALTLPLTPHAHALNYCNQKYDVKNATTLSAMTWYIVIGEYQHFSRTHSFHTQNIRNFYCSFLGYGS